MSFTDGLCDICGCTAVDGIIDLPMRSYTIDDAGRVRRVHHTAALLTTCEPCGLEWDAAQ